MITKPSHVFIVGSFRTGSHLLMEILNRSTEVRLCGETLYLRYRHMAISGVKDEFKRVGHLKTDSGAARIVNHIYSQTRGFWSAYPKHFDKSQFLSQVLASDRTYAELLDIALRLHAGPDRIPGEKTPAHVAVVPTLLKWYPNALVIQTIRDPRAVYISGRIRRKRSTADPEKPAAHPWLERLIRRSDRFLNCYMCVNVLITWLRVVNYDRKFRSRYPDHYMAVRYEDLVRDPEGEVRRICERLGVEFRQEMLDQTVMNSSHRPKRSTNGIDPSLINKWKRELNPAVDRWFRFWCSRHLKSLGYES